MNFCKYILISSLVYFSIGTVSLDAKYPFKILRVIDADTIQVEVDFLPEELGKRLSIRLLGIDTPEKGHRAKCPREKEKASIAKYFVEKQIERSKNITITIKKWDKYGGRVLGDVILDGEPLTKMLVENRLASLYTGGAKPDWCAIE